MYVKVEGNNVRSGFGASSISGMSNQSILKVAPGKYQVLAGRRKMAFRARLFRRVEGAKSTGG